jgi:hypothetical protein
MASVIRFFMGPEDERALFRDLAPLGLELYPEIVPADWQAPQVDESVLPLLVEPAYYLGAPHIGPITVDKVKRGPNKGKWMIFEIISPVIHYRRSLVDPEDGTLRSGQIWAELQVSGDSQRRVQKAEAFERLYKQVSDIVARRARKSQPTGYLVLPDAVRLHKAGTELREEGRKGEVIRPYR